ncbi:hypothetical protein HK096_005505 [Nowakowskiella sp. JEL0078]|nr:hypothetical protein HK096_005505 [Nowakowskiella sp. JEL0078]
MQNTQTSETTFTISVPEKYGEISSLDWNIVPNTHSSLRMDSKPPITERLGPSPLSGRLGERVNNQINEQRKRSYDSDSWESAISSAVFSSDSEASGNGEFGSKRRNLQPNQIYQPSNSSTMINEKNSIEELNDFCRKYNYYISPKIFPESEQFKCSIKFGLEYIWSGIFETAKKAQISASKITLEILEADNRASNLGDVKLFYKYCKENDHHFDTSFMGSGHSIGAAIFIKRFRNQYEVPEQYSSYALARQAAISKAFNDLDRNNQFRNRFLGVQKRIGQTASLTQPQTFAQLAQSPTEIRQPPKSMTFTPVSTQQSTSQQTIQQEQLPISKKEPLTRFQISEKFNKLCEKLKILPVFDVIQFPSPKNPSEIWYCCNVTVKYSENKQLSSISTIFYSQDMYTSESGARSNAIREAINFLEKATNSGGDILKHGNGNSSDCWNGALKKASSAYRQNEKRKPIQDISQPEPKRLEVNFLEKPVAKVLGGNSDLKLNSADNNAVDNLSISIPETESGKIVVSVNGQNSQNSQNSLLFSKADESNKNSENNFEIDQEVTKSPEIRDLIMTTENRHLLTIETESFKEKPMSSDFSLIESTRSSKSLNNSPEIFKSPDGLSFIETSSRRQSQEIEFKQEYPDENSYSEAIPRPVHFPLSPLGTASSEVEFFQKAQPNIFRREIQKLIRPTRGCIWFPDNLPDPQQYPLHYAAATGDIEMVQNLATPTNIRHTDTQNRLALHWLCECSDVTARNNENIEETLWLLAGWSDQANTQTRGLEQLFHMDLNYATPLAIAMLVDSRPLANMKRKKSNVDKIGHIMSPDFRNGKPRSILISKLTQALMDLSLSLNAKYLGSEKTCWHGLAGLVEESSRSDLTLWSDIPFCLLLWVVRGGLNLEAKDINGDTGMSILKRALETAKLTNEEVRAKALAELIVVLENVLGNVGMGK